MQASPIRQQWIRFLKVSKGLLPSVAPDDDPMYNRRKLAYFGLGFSVYWVHLILVVYVFGPTPDAICITAFLGVPASLAGLGFYKYLKAAEIDDEHKNGKVNSDNTSSPITVTTTVESGQSQEGQQTTNPD